MAKISTLAGIFLVLWLAMSVGTWAGRPPTDEELGAWVDVLEGAETALRHDKLQTAMAMIAGVAARLDAIDMSEDEKAKHFKVLLGGIEEAVEADNKVKAVAIMNAIREEFQERHGNARPGAVPQRQLHEHHLHHHPDQFQDHYAAQYPNPDAVQAVKSRLKEAFYAIGHDQKEKAENILQGFYHLVNENKDLCSKEQATLFLHAIHQTEALLTKHATQQAEQEITQAAKTLGYSVLGEGRTF